MFHCIGVRVAPRHPHNYYYTIKALSESFSHFHFVLGGKSEGAECQPHSLRNCVAVATEFLLLFDTHSVVRQFTTRLKFNNSVPVCRALIMLNGEHKIMVVKAHASVCARDRADSADAVIPS